ncbi:MAG: hypothetical protein MRZ18_07295, partial [Clostridiales bacterium]|nr:hypothetical protein [Clostridiales bacterium]
DLPSDTLGRVVLLDKNDKYLRSLSEEKMYEARPANTEYCAAVSEDQGTLWKLPYAEGAVPEALCRRRCAGGPLHGLLLPDFPTGLF